MHETTRARILTNLDDDGLRDALDTDKALQLEVWAAYYRMVVDIGPGFHPDTPGREYVRLPEGYTPEWVEALGLAMVQTGQDPALWALAALEGPWRPWRGVWVQ